MTAKRGQVASLDLILSVVVFILFVALVVGYVITIQPDQSPRYGEGILDRIGFIEADRTLNREEMPSPGDLQESLFSESSYADTSDYCITLDSRDERETLVGTSCETPICEGSGGLDRHIRYVLDDHTIKQLTLWVCT